MLMTMGYKIQWCLAGLVLVLGLCLAEIELPNHLQSLDDVPAIKTKCEKNGKPDTYDRIKAAINETRDCLTGRIDPTKIKDELEEAKKTGSMDEVFGKYCNKRQEYKDCIFKTVNITKECLEEVEINALDAAIKVIQEISDFACYRDGDRLALFVAEGGPECLNSRSDQIRSCINSTLKIDTSSLSFSSFPSAIPDLKVDKKKCDDFTKLQECIVNDLEHCSDTTPANIVEALFKFVKKLTCKNIKQKRTVNLRRMKREASLIANRMMSTSFLIQRLAEECKKNGGESVHNEFLQALSSLPTCLGHHNIFSTPKEQLVNVTVNCWKEFMDKIRGCFTDEQKHLPEFFINSAQSMIEFSSDHMNFRKFSPNSGIIACFQKLRASRGPSCIERENGTTTKYLSLTTKESICQFWKDNADCIANQVKDTCTPDVELDMFVGNLTAAFQKPCKDEYL